MCSAILLIVAIISVSNSEKFLETNERVNHTHEVLYEFEQIMVNVIEAESATRGFIITGKEDYLLPFISSKATIPVHVEEVLQLTRDNPIQQRKIALLAGLVQEHLKHLDQYVELAKVDFNKAREVLAIGESRRILNQIRSVTQESRDIENQLLLQRKKQSEADANSFIIIFMTLLAVIVLVLVIVYIIIMANLKALRKAERETAGKNWMLEGTGELVKAMQGNKVLRDLSQTIITRLTDYLNVPLGALYVMDNDTVSLRMVGSYAINKNEAEITTIQTGHGIVGQAAADKKMIQLQDLKPQFFNMATTFGDIRPAYVLAFPFMFEDRVIGVIELGSMQIFSQQQKQYLELIADSVAVALVSARSREEIKQLLEETQRQAEELEAQQEELRQANEALHAKTDLLEHSQTELRMQQVELQQANTELEEKADMLEQQKHKLEHAKEEIEQQAREVELSSRYKSEFLSNMSHELRTPLNSILILSQLLAENKNSKLSEKEVEFSKNIYTSGKGLLDLINEILDLSKIEAGKMELDIEQVSLTEITQAMQAMFSEVATAKSVNFKIAVDPEVQHTLITTDKQRVEQIIKNLLSNAFKFTPASGTVELRINRRDATLICFHVSDTGIGIPHEKLELIFQAFQQADGSTKRKYGGTGLGLSISRELAHALGGEIELKSTEGKGSVFTLCLSLEFDATRSVSQHKRVSIKARPASILAQQAGIKPVINSEEDNLTGPQGRVILIIEDDEKFSSVLLDFVQERGYKGVVASQGSAGLSLARHHKPIAILLDMNLPVIEGQDVLRALKNDPQLRHIPVQIISAYDKRREGMELGAFDYIKKPVSLEDLKKAFDRIEDFTQRQPKKLLIIEDNEAQNQAIRELMGEGDIKSYSAYRGNEAYEMLCNDSFDCIIVDLGLPDISGFDLLEKIKRNEALNKIPIIVYTGRDLKKDETIRLNKLSDTVVLKTANSQERLLDEVTLFLHRVESKLPADQQSLLIKLHNRDEILHGKKILLVDDDIRNIYALTNVLEEEGLHCIAAENGKVALNLLQQNHDIDLVLMDIMMPEMDGYEATIAIRQQDKFKSLPIIALTAKAMKGDKEKCLAVGMSDYVSKPINIIQLLSLMRVWLYK